MTATTGPATGQAVLVGGSSGLWTDALRVLRHDTYHLPSYVEADAVQAGGKARAFLYRDDDRTMLVPLLLREIPGTDRVDACSPYGYPGPISDAPPDDERFWTAAIEALRRELHDIGAVSVFLRLNPLLPCALPVLDRAGALRQTGPTVAIDLSGTEDPALAYRRNHRVQIARAREAGLRIVIDDWSLEPGFRAAYAETMDRVGATEYYRFSPTYFDRLRMSLGTSVHLMVALSGRDVVAGSICFESDGIVQYHLGCTASDALRLQPSKLVIADAARWAQERGCRVLHLGGGLGGREDSLLSFKRGFSSWTLVAQTWRSVVDQQAYAAILRDRDPSADPHDVDGYFPRYRDPALTSPSV